MFELVISPSMRSFGPLAGRDVQVRRVALDHLLEQDAQVDGGWGRAGAVIGGGNGDRPPVERLGAPDDRDLAVACPA